MMTIQSLPHPCSRRHMRGRQGRVISGRGFGSDPTAPNPGEQTERTRRFREALSLNPTEYLQRSAQPEGE